MKTEHIDTIFSNYLEEPNTQYAILINGSWGSGKTYYWKEDLTQIAETKKFKTIYISLNGISSIKSIEQMLFYKLLPLLGDNQNKYIQGATKLFGNAANALSRLFTKADFGDLVKGISVDTFKFDKYVICFDDLERCQLPIQETLGFINNYTEHKYLKTIIFADEKKIDQTQKGYDNIKEKVIGRILNFELEIKASTQMLINKYEKTNSDYFTFLCEYKEFIVAIFENCNQNNLRISSFYFNILEVLFPKIKNIDEQFRSEIVLFSAIISIEFKQGYLKSNEHNNPKGIQCIDKNFPALFILQENSDAENNKYEKTFYSKYLTEHINTYQFYYSIFSFILSGFLDEENLKEEIKNRYPEIISKEIFGFRKLMNYNFRELSNNEFNKLLLEVHDYSIKGYYSIYDYAQIANFFYFFSKKDLTKMSTDQINEFIETGLKKAKEKKEIDANALANLMHFKDLDPRVLMVKNRIREIHLEIQNEFDIENANTLLQIFINEKADELEQYFDKNKYSNSVFTNIDSIELFNAIIKTSNKHLAKFIKIIRERYESVNIGEFLSEDYATLKVIMEKINAETEKITSQPQKYILTELADVLKLSCGQLERKPRE